MGSLQVVGLGMACLDIIIRASELPTWERGGRLSALAIEGGGPVATALVAAQRLGASTGFIGTYGNDRLGEIKMQTLVENRVDVQKAIRRNAPENQVVLVAVNEASGERVFSGVRVESEPLSPTELDVDYICRADILHLDGYHIEAALQAAEWMKNAGKPVMLDGSATRGPVSPEMVELVRRVDYLICGSGFGQAVTGEADLWQAGLSLVAMGPKVVVQTEGKNGSFTTTRDCRFHVPAFDVPVVDTTGAGDVFHGAFLVGLLRRWDLRSIVLFSSAVAALKCTQLGGRKGIPTFEDARAFLESRGIRL